MLLLFINIAIEIFNLIFNLLCNSVLKRLCVSWDWYSFNFSLFLLARELYTYVDIRSSLRSKTYINVFALKEVWDWTSFLHVLLLFTRKLWAVVDEDSWDWVHEWLSIVVFVWLLVFTRYIHLKVTILLNIVHFVAASCWSKSSLSARDSFCSVRPKFLGSEHHNLGGKMSLWVSFLELDLIVSLIIEADLQWELSALDFYFDCDSTFL